MYKWIQIFLIFKINLLLISISLKSLWLLRKIILKFFFPSRLPEVNPLLHLTTLHFSDAALLLRLLRTIATHKAQACLWSRGWGKHQTQSCLNLSRHACCLPVAVSAGHLIATYQGNPCYLDNHIGRSVNGVQTKGASHFYFIQIKIKNNDFYIIWDVIPI